MRIVSCLSLSLAVACALAVGFAGATSHAQPAPLSLQVNEASVQVSNLTPRGDVVLLSCVRHAREHLAITDSKPREGKGKAKSRRP